MFDTNGIYFTTATILRFQLLLLDDRMKEHIISSFKYLVHQDRMTLYAFVIMPNHIHVIWSDNEHGLNESSKTSFLKFTANQFLKHLKKYDSKTLQKFYVNKADRKYQFWQRTSLDIEVFSTKVFDQKLEYIHNNPLQEKWQLAEEATGYKYSSAKFYEEGIDEFGILSDYYSA